MTWMPQTPAKDVDTERMTDAQVDAYHRVDRSKKVTLKNSKLERVTRIRLTGLRRDDNWKVSYAHGILKDGTPVTVNLPRKRFTRREDLMNQLVAMAEKQGVSGDLFSPEILSTNIFDL